MKNWTTPTKEMKAKNSRLKNTYGIDLAEYLTMEAKQDGLCAICKKPPLNIPLSVDHCHVYTFKKTGKSGKVLKNPKKTMVKGDPTHVRGLLCHYCNKYIVGALEHRKIDARQVLKNLIVYFENNFMRGEIPDKHID